MLILIGEGFLEIIVVDSLVGVYCVVCVVMYVSVCIVVFDLDIGCIYLLFVDYMVLVVFVCCGM